MAIEVERVSDEVLEMAAEENGPGSVEAQVLAWLRLQRSGLRLSVQRLHDRRPIPDARTELAMIEIVEEEDEI